MLTQLIRRWSVSHPNKVFLSGYDKVITYSNAVEEIERMSFQISQMTHDKEYQKRTAVIFTEDGNISSKMLLWEIAALDRGIDIAYLDSSIPSKKLAAMVSALSPNFLYEGGEVTLRQEDGCAGTDLSSEVTECGNLIFHTSGTTGFPKQVTTPASKLLQYATSRVADECITSDSRILLASSSMFDPSQGDFFSTLQSGCTLCVPDFNSYVAETGLVVQRTRPTHVLTTPTVWEGITESESQKVLADTFLSVISLGGELMSSRLKSLWATSETHTLLNVYGQTEHVVYQSSQIITSVSNPHNIGRPYPHVKYSLSKGILCINDNPTGDRAKLSSTGDYIFEGRNNPEVDLQRKIHGRRVDLSEVNNFISKCLSLPCYSVMSGKDVVCFVSCSKSHDLIFTTNSNHTRLVQQLYFNLQCIFSALHLASANELPHYMFPRNIIFVSDIPKGPTGKVDLPSLTALAELSNLDQMCASIVELIGGDITQEYVRETIQSFNVDTTEPTTVVERAVAMAWKKEFGVEEVFLESNFFSIGGDSMSALRTVREVRFSLSPETATTGNSNEALHGDIKGTFSPAELLRRPILKDYCEYIASALDITCDTLPDSCFEEPAPRRCSLLFKSAACGSLLAIDILIKQCGLDPNGGINRNCRGTSPLHIAAREGDSGCCKKLIGLGASVCSTTSIGTSPLHVAAGAGHREIVKLLIDAGAPASIKDLNKQTCLYYAARNGHADLCADLINVFCIPTNIYDRWGRSPVHWSVINNNPSVLRVLLSAGLSLTDTRTKAHKTRLAKEHPLDLAARMHPDADDLHAVLREFSAAVC
eukprot:TRINITY_DN19048_c0_g1_i1.p1 TRINITY_DN19048_c0_g1~~TRINITY_DN19048_c0_g1_i1.p1  ORF type:complete len:819 (+),score=125.22 TRINITY_DN19048_c0_g1_i1:43-2499(+)